MGRYYKKDGKELPSVTTITGQLDKPALVHWAANCACDYIIDEINRLSKKSQGIELHVDDLLPIVESARKNFRNVSKKALDIGSQVHDAIEQYLLTGKEPFNPPDEVLSAFVAFLEWKDRYKIETLKTEHSVYGERYAGTTDWICMLNDKKYYIDFKAAKGIYPEMKYQIAGYRQTDDSPEECGCGILRLDKESGQPEWKDTTLSYEADVNIFNILTDLWWTSHPRLLKKFLEAE